MAHSTLNASRARLGGFARAAFAALTFSAGVGLLGVACGDLEGAAPAPPPAPGTSSGSGNVFDAGVLRCAEGTVRPCHVVAGDHDGVLTCFVGVERCAAGAWTTCAGETEGRFESKIATGNGGVTQRALTDAGSCNSPCDPACQSWSETPDGGVTVIPTITGVYQTGTLEDALANSPPGFINKGVDNPCAGVGGCEFDMQCLEGTCTQWKAGETISSCTEKPDYTTGFACVNADGKRVIPVCNRGKKVAPAGARLYVFPGNSSDVSTNTCTASANNSGFYVTTEPIPSGGCINVEGTPALLPGNGTRSLLINPPLTPAGVPNPALKDECFCSNNWGVWSGSSTQCVDQPNIESGPLTYKQTYEATCAAGKLAVWGYFAYASLTPAGTNIDFKGHTADSVEGLADAAASPLRSLAVAQLSPDTQNCPLTGPSPCPIDLASKLGSPDVNRSVLELVATLTPITDTLTVPTLTSWDVTYTCVDNE